MKRLFLFLSIGLFCGPSFAQDLTPFKLYQYDLKLINPAFAGIKNGHQFTSFVKRGVGDRALLPTYLLFSYETQLSGINSGIGVTFQNQPFHNWNQSDWRLSYNHQLKLQKAGNLVIGVNLDRKNVNHNSSVSLSPGASKLLYSNTDMDVGMVYHHNSFYGGVTINNIFNIQKSSDETIMSVREQRHLRFTSTILGSKFQVNNWLSINPSIIYHHSLEWDIIDANFTSEIKNLFIVGFTRRFKSGSDIFSINAGFNWKDKVQIVGIVHSNYFIDDSTVELSLRYRVHKD